MLVQLEVLIPLLDNAGRRFSWTSWVTLHRRFLALAGGFSRHDGVVGQWEAAGRVYRDRSRRYIVAIRSWRQFPAWLEVVEWALSEFQQEALYISVQGIAEILERQEP